MPNENPARRPVRLGVEALEGREVPATFGANSGMSLAVGDVVPGGGTEFVTGTGPGRQALVRVFDGAGTLKYQIQPFGTYQGGVYTAVGDVNNDGQLEIIVSTAGGTTGRVRVYQFTNLSLQSLADFTPFGPTYNGGVQIAIGNVAGDRTQEIVVGMESGGSVVKVYANEPTSAGEQFFRIRRFEAFGAGYTGGVSISAANVDARLNTVTDPYDYNYSEIVIGRSVGAPTIRIFDAQAPTVVRRASYYAFDPNIQANNVGISVVAGNTDGGRGAEIYAVQRNSTRVRVFNGQTGVPIGDFNVPYPLTYTRNLNLTILNASDDFNIPPINNPTNLYVVGSEGPFEQVPVVFPGTAGSPAGFNGSRPAP